MSRHESDREDLLREATALVERAELRLLGVSEPIVVGFRRNGSASFYFGADPVYQFNAAGQLRRAYVGGLLYKATAGQLVSLRRLRTSAEVALISCELTATQAIELLADCRARLTLLQHALVGGSFQLVGQAPAEGPIVPRIQAWLAALPPTLVIARAPHAG